MVVNRNGNGIRNLLYSLRKGKLLLALVTTDVSNLNKGIAKDSGR